MKDFTNGIKRCKKKINHNYYKTEFYSLMFSFKNLPKRTTNLYKRTTKLILETTAPSLIDNGIHCYATSCFNLQIIINLTFKSGHRVTAKINYDGKTLNL